MYVLHPSWRWACWWACCWACWWACWWAYWWTWWRTRWSWCGDLVRKYKAASHDPSLLQHHTLLRLDETKCSSLKHFKKKYHSRHHGIIASYFWQGYKIDSFMTFEKSLFSTAWPSPWGYAGQKERAGQLFDISECLLQNAAQNHHDLIRQRSPDTWPLKV